ncbi:lysozyme [Pantoea sp. CCBC3-3-1]|uniref:lysozyme n=1 Tax=Pantoea sp. CCBC3-3-1 TaxID=2490851 RepID=UPI0011BED2A9|nr:lysozyme [Pantoea sp. CCBC3-3-1]
MILIKTKRGEGLLAYLDSVGVWTIGVGHTGTVDGKPIAKGMTITPAQSNILLLSDLAWVESAINGNVKVPLKQNQYDALCSFVFNVGLTAFVNSTLLKKLNRKDYKGAADQLLQWKRAGSIADLLLQRRKRERELFIT